MEQLDAMQVEALTEGELAGATGATVLGRAVGYAFGFMIGLIADADPHDGTYWCLGA